MVKEDDYLLTNQEILGGLKAAIERGQNLKEAMMTFYQAGYKKEEIEDAARAYIYLQRGNSEVEVLNKEKEETKSPNKEKVVSGFNIKKESQTEYSGVQKTFVPLIGGEGKEEKSGKKVVQKISGYNDQKDLTQFKSSAVTSILVVTLLVLIGILALVFLFKSELIDFINGLFG